MLLRIENKNIFELPNKLKASFYFYFLTISKNIFKREFIKFKRKHKCYLKKIDKFVENESNQVNHPFDIEVLNLKQF